MAIKKKLKAKEETQTPVEAQLLAYKDANAKLKQENVQLKEKMGGMVEMSLELQPYIAAPPVRSAEDLYDKACSNDGHTVKSWEKQWLEQISTNAARYSFETENVMQEFGKNAYRPCIVAGSGPSLKKNVALLADSEKRGEVCLVSCLHNFGYFTDLGVKADYYVNLDAGDITIPEVAQGGKESAEYYWERTKDQTLVTAVQGNPELLKKWRGRILFYNTLVSDQAYIAKLRKITTFSEVINVGGNALGACLNFARGVLGSGVIGFVGADFCFSYAKKFHPFDSPYDQKYAGIQYWTDIWGNKVGTWPSYLNFKFWFDYVACGTKHKVPGIFINCTEGGILGSYAEGNIQQIRQWSLDEFLHMHTRHRALTKIMAERPNEYVFTY